MGTIFKKVVTRTLPADAELFTRKGELFAKWTPRGGKVKTAPVITGRDGTQRIRSEATTYTAKYRDGEGIVREVPTGCRDKQAARAKLAELMTRAEKIRGGVYSPSESQIADHQLTPLDKHIDAYIDYLKARGKNADRIKTTDTRLKESALACGFRRLADLRADPLRAWLDEQSDAGRSVSVVNGYAAVWTAFGFWCTGKRIVGRQANMSGDKRLLTNPFEKIGLLDPKSDRRRTARPLNEDEMRRLIETATSRPLIDARTVRRGKNKGMQVAQLTEAHEAKLQRTGRERALIYKTAILTGLRLREIRTLTVGDLELNASPAYLTLQAGNEKNREGSHIAIRSDLAEDLRGWLALRLNEVNTAGEGGNLSSLASLPPSLPVFDVPTGLLRIFNRDLKLAGIPKVDEHGCVVHVHGLRHTFGTELVKSGASPKTAQTAMRHSDIRLTMQTYTHIQLMDVSGAIEKLPNLPLVARVEQEIAPAVLKATGTDDRTPRAEGESLVAPTVAPNWCNAMQKPARIRKTGPSQLSDEDTKKPQKSREILGFCEVEPRRVELPTSALRMKKSTDEKPRKSRGETTYAKSGCTNGCTTNPNPDNAPPSRVQGLLAELSPSEVAELRKLLMGGE